MKKKILIFLTVITVAIMALTVVACNKNESNTPDGDNSTECTHTFGEWVTVDAPTCTTAGSKKHTCSLCGEEETGSIEATGHSWGKWETTKEVTCTEDGSKKRECQVCNLPETENVKMLGHNYVDGVCLNCGLAVPTATSGLEYTLNDDGESYSVIGIGTATDTDIVIPATYNDKPVTSIGEEAFWDCSQITSITIPDSVTSIGGYALESTAWYDNQPDGLVYVGKVLYKYKGTMPNNTSIEILAGTKGIADNAFYNCSGLTSITIPDSVTNIGDIAFSACSGLTSITIGNSVTSIGDEAFEFCRGLTSINIPASMTNIGDLAFWNCSGLTRIDFAGTVEEWQGISKDDSWDLETGEYVIYCTDGEISKDGYNKTELEPTSGLEYALNEDGESYSVIGIGTATDTDIVIPATYNDKPVTSIGEDAFSECNQITSITLPDSVTSIGDGAFYYCGGLTSITVDKNNPRYYSINNCIIETATKTLILGCQNSVIPADGSVTSIGNSAFGGCDKLTSIAIPESVMSIGESAFQDCYELTNITIPESVTSIGERAFQECSNLAIIITIPDGVTSIGRFTFAGCNQLMGIIIPDSVTSIGEFAFNSCWELTIIMIPNSVTSIGYGAFQDCIGLTRIEMPDRVTSIGSYAFYGCSRLTSIEIPDRVTSIGSYAFSKCNELTSIAIPDRVTSIGREAFYGCSRLTSIAIPDSVTSIEEGTFCECRGLTRIDFGGTVDEWQGIINQGHDWDLKTGEYVIYCTDGEIAKDGTVTYYKTELEPTSGLRYTLNEDGESYSVAGIGTATDTDIVIGSIYNGKPVTSIGNYAFYDCSELTSITISEGVTSIGAEAFRGCSGLTSITISDSVESFGSVAFRGCSGLKSITIPDKVECIEDYAFYDCSGLTSITIGKGVKDIGYCAFSLCSGLTRIDFDGTVEEWQRISKGRYWNNSTGNYTVYCTDGEIAKDGTITYYK